MLPPFAQLLFKAKPVPVCRLVFRSILNAAVAEVCRGKQRVFDITAAEHLAAKRRGEHRRLPHRRGAVEHLGQGHDGGHA